MRTATLKATASAWTTSNFPNRNNSASTRLFLSGGAVHRRAWLWFPPPIPAGARILQATLRLTFVHGWVGKTFHLDIFRITSPWKASKITDNNTPTVDASIDGGADLSGLHDGDVVEFDLADVLAPIAGGAPWYGLRVVPDAGATENDQTIWGAEAVGLQPELVISYTVSPLPPTDLRPSGGRVVSSVRPTLTWQFNSTQADATQAQAQVQVATDLTFAAPVWDSGLEDNVASSRQVGVDLDPDTTYYWRVLTRDDSGDTSEFSDPAAFSIHGMDTLVVDYPVGPVPDSTPTIEHTFGGTQARAEWLVLDTSGAILHDSGIQATTDAFYTLPSGVVTGEGTIYRAVVRVWDDLDREAAPGDPGYVEASALFSYSPSADVGPVTDLVATPRTDPAVDLTWTYPAGAEWFALILDGSVVADGLTPEDLGGGPTYHLRYWRAAPGRPHTFEVRAVVDDGGVLKHSAANATAVLTPTVAGTWVVRPSSGDAVQMWGRDSQETAIGEDTTVFIPAGRADPVLGMASLRGDEGSLAGVILDSEAGDFSADAQARTIRRFKELAGEDELRAAWGPYNIAILLLPGTTVSARPGGGYDVVLPFAQVLEPTLPSAQADPVGFGESGWGD